MLGIANGLQYGGYLNNNVFSYCSDFSSDADSWQAYSVEDSASDLTFAANANPYTDLGGSAPNSSGWLKCTYGVDQTSTSGTQLIIDESPFFIDTLAGDEWIVTGNIYVHDDDEWSGVDGTNITAGIVINNSSSNKSITPGSVLDFTFETDGASGSFDTVKIEFPNRKPQTNAVIYLKNLCITVNRP